MKELERTVINVPPKSELENEKASSQYPIPLFNQKLEDTEIPSEEIVTVSTRIP
jgi:hypothetical protein